MELHHVGKNCNLEICKRLDFLPFKCVNCNKEFCEDHHRPSLHQCKSSSPIVDVKVPVCPLCNSPVPITRGQDPNLKVNEHIAQGCPNKSTNTIPENICNAPGCKAKLSLVGQDCTVCKLRYCLKHRFEDSHQCPGPPQAVASVSHFASKFKAKFSTSKSPTNQGPLKSPKKGKDAKCIVS